MNNTYIEQDGFHAGPQSGSGGTGRAGQRLGRRTRGAAAGLLLAATLAGPAQSQTWSVRASGTVQALNDVVFSSANTAIAVGNNGDITASGDGGATWVAQLGVAAAALDVVFSNAGTAIAAGVRTGVFNIQVSSDRGGSWALAGIPAGNEDLGDGLFVNQSTAIVVDNRGGAGDILRSTDRGASWVQNAYVAGDHLNAVTSRGGRVVAVGQNTEVAFSSDLGAVFSGAVSSGTPNGNLNDVALITATTAVAVGQNGLVIRSTDGGDRWRHPHSAAGDLNAVDSRGAVVVAAGDAGTLARSGDSGLTWTTPLSGTGQNLNDVLFLTPSVLLAVGDNGTIIGSSDGGLNWSSQTSTTANNLTDLAFNGVNGVVAVGASGTILLSGDQLNLNQPIPFQSKWLLVLLLVGYGAWTLHARRSA